MDIINYVLDIPKKKTSSVDILQYKKIQLDTMLTKFYEMESQYISNQKIIYHSRVPFNIKYFHSQIIDYITKVWSNICYLNNSTELKNNILKLYSEITKHENFNKSDLDYNKIIEKIKKLNKEGIKHNKISELRTIYASTLFILIVFSLCIYYILHLLTNNICIPFRDYSNNIYLLVRLITTIIVFYLCLGSYYYLGDIIWFILKAFFNLFIWIIKALLYIFITIIISLVYILKFIIMGSILVGTSIYQIFAIIIKFIVAIPATIDNIVKYGDTSLVMEEISFDLDLSFSMDSIGLGFLDSIDTWLSFDWIELSIGGFSAEFLKDFGLGLVKTTNDFKIFLSNINLVLKPTEEKIAEAQSEIQALKQASSSQTSLSSHCYGKSFLEKMIINANKDKKYIEEDTKIQKPKKQTGKQNFIKCISS